MESGHRQFRPVDGESLEREQARLLYEYAGPGVVATTMASTFLAIVIGGNRHSGGILAWWATMQIVTIGRGWELLQWRSKVRQSDYVSTSEIRRFSRGALTHAFGWATFPFLFFTDIGPPDRAAMATILSAMASGAVTVLSPSLRLAIQYCLFLLLPSSLMFLLEGGKANSILGFLGVIFCLILIQLARTSYGATVSAIRLSKTNENLVGEMKGACAELATAQHALKDINANLEVKIRARTLDLQKEVSERARYAQELTRVATTDALTGLRNRSSFSKQLKDSLDEAQYNGGRVAVLFIDLDKFKEVNDVRGHEAGDRVLLDVAQRLLATLPPEAEIGRWGGDEFVVMLAGVDGIEGVLETANLLRECLTLPIDLVPDFLPVIGHLDDAVVVAWALRVAVRGAGRERVEAHWSGTPAGLERVLRLAGVA